MIRADRLRASADAALLEQATADVLRAAGRFQFLADDVDCPDVMRLAALMEELGEVARCVHDHDHDGLPRELHQLAGVAIAWASIL